MKHGRVLLLVVFCLLVIALPAAAQNSPLVAFVNSSGQLIVSSGDGASYRWIVTNPGEKLAGEPSWTVNGLTFAVGASLRVANPASQAVSEIGTASGTMLSVAQDGKSLFYQQQDGSYALQQLNGSGNVSLSLTNDRGAPYSGLWSGTLVAYWGYAGNSVLAVDDVGSGNVITLDSGRSAPITPLAWRPRSAQLIFRDTTGSIRMADLACLPSGCNGNPLDSAPVLAVADTDVATDGNMLYYRADGNINAVNLDCGNSCNGVAIAGNAAPQTAISAANGTLVYTAYQQNPNDPSDREVQTLNLGCVSNPSSCTAQTVLSGASAGVISSDGRFAVVQTSSGLSSLDLSSGATAYLSDTGASLTDAHWQP
ncbi:MAG: hypothetical protein GC204_17235 [Chloroflexi bacterium]|nr:hypothetical protein [Chloroflexota bacterium]